MTSRRLIHRFVLASLFSLWATVSLAQPWPAKPIKVVVNFPPGGAADQIARVIGQPLSEALGQPVVIENRAGANGNLGGEAVAKSAPDGYTLLMSSGGMVSVNPHIYARMSFDPTKDLTPVAAAARVLVFLVVKPSLPVDNVQQFLAYTKANPGKLTFGSAGNGSSPHLAAEMMKSQAGLFAVHVPYR
ncbi:MAG: tripartite tricarboxylate transporter substrate binding protein, partial [Betaproteobacteria bacterium]|nr:tripartite tricarboxylate transporter substrate binding protein [Betaproteobacteria bacterium]